MRDFIKLHRLDVNRQKMIPDGEVLVNIHHIVTVHPEGDHAKIAVTGDEGYFYVFESFDEIWETIEPPILVEDFPANLFFHDRG